MPNVTQFNKMFSFPREPETALSPGQHFDLRIPKNKKILITDVYIENLGGGLSILEILEQRSTNSFENRYTFRTAMQQVTVVDFTTGLKLGDEAPIAGSIRISNSEYSKANILPRVNGVFID